MDDRWITPLEQSLITAIQEGFPLVARPFDQIGEKLGITGSQVVQMLEELRHRDVIKRMGIIVRHRELGYKANAMCVWDVPDLLAAEIGKRICTYDFVTLCYCRHRSLPQWPFNMYCMIHGRMHHEVLELLHELIEGCELGSYRHQVLFSQRRFKQCGARFFNRTSAEKVE